MTKKIPEDPFDDDDGFDDERLASARHKQTYQQACENSGESFTSFSEGMPAIDKFQIVDDVQGATVIEAKPINPPSAPPANKSSSSPILSPSKFPSLPTRPVGTGVLRKSSVKDQSAFTSFSEGLPSINKFGIVDPDCREGLIDLRSFLGHCACSYLAAYRIEGDLDDDTVCDGLPLSKTANKPFQSNTLDRLMYLLDLVPWQDKIQVELSSKPSFREYSFDECTMVFDAEANDEELVLAFAHQSYHATNRLLTKLYSKDMLDQATFVDLFVWAEVAALITELNVKRDLALEKAAPPKVLCQGNDGILYSVNVENYLQGRGMKALHDALYSSKLRGSKETDLVQVYLMLYDVYANSFETESKTAQLYIEWCISSGLERDCI